MKKCKKCNLFKQLVDFCTDNRLVDKKGALCKICKRLKMKEYKLNRKDKIKIERKNYYENNKEKELANNRKYIECNKDKVDQDRKNYYESNKPLINAKAQRYQATLKGRLIMWRHNAKRRHIKWGLTIDHLQSLPMICHYTGETLTLERNKNNTISLDRVDSTKGYYPGNVVFCCSIINVMKKDHDIQDFVEWCGKVYTRMASASLSSIAPVSLDPASMI